MDIAREVYRGNRKCQMIQRNRSERRSSEKPTEIFVYNMSVRVSRRRLKFVTYRVDACKRGKLSTIRPVRNSVRNVFLMRRIVPRTSDFRVDLQLWYVGRLMKHGQGTLSRRVHVVRNVAFLINKMLRVFSPHGPIKRSVERSAAFVILGSVTVGFLIRRSMFGGQVILLRKFRGYVVRRRRTMYSYSRRTMRVV